MKRSGQFSTFNRVANGSNFYSWRPPPRMDITSSNPGETPSPTTSASSTPAALLRVQVKSSSYLQGTGYYCEFKPRNYKEGYSLKEVDLFAAYVIPTTTWYLIPAAALLRHHIQGLMLCPVRPSTRCPYTYETYRGAWGLLSKDRRALARHGKVRPTRAAERRHMLAQDVSPG